MSATQQLITLPGTERRISRIGLGAMQLSLDGRPARDQAKAVIRAAVEAGCVLIDSADVYARDDSDIGHNERLIAEALGEMGLQADDPSLVVATKGGRTRPGGRWAIDGHPDHLRDATFASLKALGCDRISLYQLHTPDPDVAFADSVGALARLRDEGVVEAVGLSNVTVDQIETARSIVPIASIQNQASVWDMGYRRSPVVTYCHSNNVIFLAHSPLGGSSRAARLSESVRLANLARRLQTTPQILALAWLLYEGPAVVPIPGASSPARIQENATALSLQLTPSDRRELRRACRELPGQMGLGGRVRNKIRHLLGATG